MTHDIENRNSWTEATSRSRDIKRPPKPTRKDATTVFVGRNQGARHDTAKVVVSFFVCGSIWEAEPNMWSDARCTYASLQYQHATAVALSAKQHIGVEPGEYIHLTLGDDTTHTHVTERMDQMLRHKPLKGTADNAAFRRHMKAGKQLGADLMTERAIRENNQEKQLLAKPQPINVAAWDETIITELGHTNDEIEPTDLHTKLDAMDMEVKPEKTTNDTAKTRGNQSPTKAPGTENKGG